ncbi:MAG: T9SS type A sorting domain-containing protein [candidate division WOR-3 bacterium]
MSKYLSIYLIFLLLPLSLFGYGVWYYFEPTPHRQTAGTAMCYGRYEGAGYGRLYAIFRDRVLQRNRFYYADCKFYGNPTWVELAPLPEPAVDTGANLAYCYIPASDEHLIFAIKGKGSREFWVYDIPQDTWRRLEDLLVPATLTSALETGNYTSWEGLPSVGIYFLEGNSEYGGGQRWGFYRYHYSYTPRGQGQIGNWERLTNTSVRQYYPELAYVPPREEMYAVVDAPYPDSLWKYKISTGEWIIRRRTLGPGQWDALATLGVVGTECLFPHTGDTLYYLRGYNTNNFDDYRISENTWHIGPKDPVLKVGIGSDLAYGLIWVSGYAGKGMWAFFGNNTDTFGFFNPYITLPEEGGQGNSSGLIKDLKVVQNPSANKIKFQLPSPFRIEIYDNTGRFIFNASGKDELVWNYEDINPGVYFYLLKTKVAFHCGKIIIYR